MCCLRRRSRLRWPWWSIALRHMKVVCHLVAQAAADDAVFEVAVRHLDGFDVDLTTLHLSGMRAQASVGP